MFTDLMGNTAEEIPTNERAIALGTNVPEVYLVQSNIFMKLNRPDDGLAVAQKGVEAIPNSAADPIEYGFLVAAEKQSLYRSASLF